MSEEMVFICKFRFSPVLDCSFRLQCSRVKQDSDLGAWASGDLSEMLHMVQMRHA